jgi:hypothetical protein
MLIVTTENITGKELGIKEADMAYEAVTGKIDDHGLVHEVSGCRYDD